MSHYRSSPIGARIQVVRKAAELSQRQVAEAVGIKRATIANIESGRQGTDVSVLIRICRTLQVTVAALIGETPDEREAEIRAEGRREAAHRLGILEGSHVWRLMTAEQLSHFGDRL